MKSSILIMDLIFKLKLHFPQQIFYIRGNHDSFSESISKQGVPQGLLWKKELKKTRGEAYLKEMQKFYDKLAYMAYSNNFICCHAGPPTFDVNMKALINASESADLIKDLINRRLSTPSRLSGYTSNDITKLRKVLKVDQSTPFIVGHTPMDHEETVWENVGGIKAHHIIYSAQPHIVGAMVQINQKMYPLIYMVEPISELINKDYR